MSAFALYTLTSVADLIIATGAFAKATQALAFGRRLDAVIWTVFAVAAVILVIAYGFRAASAS